MNIFILPSWYPSDQHPSTGIFFREQALALAKHYPESHVGISTWGPNDPSLLLEVRQFSKWPHRIHQVKHLLPSEVELLPNCVEYSRPTLTWSRRWRKGNMDRIIQACLGNARDFEQRFGKIDLVHAHVGHPGGYAAMHVARVLQVPYVVTEHMSPFPLTAYSSPRAFRRWLAPVFAHSSANIAVSSALQSKMEARGIVSRVIPNLVDESSFPLAESFDPVEILAIGRLEEQKGFSYLLEAFHGIRDRYPHHQLTIMGSGSLKNELQLMAQRLHLRGRIQWVGEASRSQIVAALERASFLVLPSLHENLPLVLLEAIASGKPVIATRCEGPEDIVNSANGLLSQPANGKDLQKQLEQMIDNRAAYDSEAIRADFEERFSSDVVTRQLMDLYQEVLLRPSSKRDGTKPRT